MNDDGSSAMDQRVKAGESTAGALENVPTNRGFSCFQWKDIYGMACRLQKSSLADLDAIWLGGDGAMHLDQEQVAKLLPILQRFVETGSLAMPQTEAAGRCHAGFLHHIWHSTPHGHDICVECKCTRPTP